ncbi:MAG TPA: serine/threonine protein kinase, partial [Planctomycetes bacterium]|nr:serine/threonine protein kinase [Planctomycetota bacterium]
MGEQVGPYRLEGELGRGGMGAVYRATDTRSGREVALKLLHGLAGSEDRARFLREIEAASSLVHPHVLPVFEHGSDQGRPFLATALAEGGSLAGRLRLTPLDPAPAALLVSQVARGLEAAHRSGILHRDLKPENVLLDGEGRPLLADFGLARQVKDETLTASGTVLGTPGYMSPEQARGERAGVRSDVYGLGALLYASLAARPPFRGRSLLETLAAVVADPPAPIPGVPESLWRVLQRCLAKDP